LGHVFHRHVAHKPVALADEVAVACLGIAFAEEKINKIADRLLAEPVEKNDYERITC